MLNVTFGEVSDEAVRPVQAPESGLVGLAYRSLARDNVVPLFDQLVEQNLVEANAFGMFLNFDEHGNRQGQLSLGGVDEDLIAGPFTYTPVSFFFGFVINLTSQSYCLKKIIDTEWYTLYVGSITVDGDEVATSVRAIVDSG